VKIANRGSMGVRLLLRIEFKPPFTITSTTSRKRAMTIIKPSMVLMMRGLDPRAQNLRSRIVVEENVSGHMSPDPPSFRNRTVTLCYKRAI
jgi:hypothetical protein